MHILYAQVAPNWRTSYRLQPSGLVGIVKLGSSKEPLSRVNDIQWAEICPVDMNLGRDRDHEMRSKGKMAFRLLSRGDCPSFAVDVDAPIDMRTPVAIIDLRVFVPEVVSVLATFAQVSIFYTSTWLLVVFVCYISLPHFYYTRMHMYLPFTLLCLHCICTDAICTNLSITNIYTPLHHLYRSRSSSICSRSPSSSASSVSPQASP